MIYPKGKEVFEMPAEGNCRIDQRKDSNGFNYVQPYGRKGFGS